MNIGMQCSAEAAAYMVRDTVVAAKPRCQAPLFRAMIPSTGSGLLDMLPRLSLECDEMVTGVISPPCSQDVILLQVLWQRCTRSQHPDLRPPTPH